MQSDIQKAASSVKGRKPQTLRITTHYCIPTYASPDNGRVPAAPTTMFGLLFRSDVQTAATITGLSPPPARFGVCLRPTVFVITFPVFLTWLYHSRPGGICQYAFSVSRNNLFAVFCGVFVQVAHSFVHTQRTQVCLRRIRCISVNRFRHCRFSVEDIRKTFCIFLTKPLDNISFMLYIVDTKKKGMIPMK